MQFNAEFPRQVMNFPIIDDRGCRGLFSVFFLADKRLETGKFGKQCGHFCRFVANGKKNTTPVGSL